jgi:hypothetical protein
MSVVQATVGRDRVLDLTKSFALLVVVLGHALAWDVSTGEPASVLDLRPDLRWVTWLLQVLPLFFAAGAVSNLASWRRRGVEEDFWRRRIGRLATPAVLYATVWTAVLLPLAAWSPTVELVGRYFAQLLWFLGVYAAIVVAVPLTARWVESPRRTLTSWLVVIIVVDLVRWKLAPSLGWVNMLLVWGWLHQLGYSLPALRAVNRPALVSGGLVAFAAALGVAVVGPYSTSMVSIAGDPGLSNLSPPTVVLALYGLAQVLVLAAVWPVLDMALRWRPAWLVVAGFGSRALEVYLWHVPLVGVVAGCAWLLELGPSPFSRPWWALHVAAAAAVVTGAWLLGGPMGRVSRRLADWASGLPGPGLAPLGPAVVVSLSILAVSQTGFATWWGPGLVGLSMTTLPIVVLLVLAWWTVQGSGGVGAHDARRLPGGHVTDLPGRDTALAE